MNKSFRNIHGAKNRSSSSSFISLHFNKADDEQLEIISHGDKADGSDKFKDDEKEKGPLQELPLTSETAFSRNLNETNSDDSNPPSISRDESNSSIEDPSKDSLVKDYWSRISKRAYSLDSDLGAVSTRTTGEKDGWMLFKDIKGKLEKKLEERKSNLKFQNKDDKSHFFDSSKDLEKKLDSDLTPTENELLGSLSPAIEASELKHSKPFYDSYVNNELDRARCEILSSKPVPSTNLNAQQLPSRKSFTTTSTLPPISENKVPIPIETSVPTDQTENKVSSSQELDTTSQTFRKLFDNMKNVLIFIKTHWKNVTFRILIAVMAFILAPIPSWISGFLCGACITGFLVFFLFKPSKPKKQFVLPDFSKSPLTNIPVTEIEDNIIYKGWMNELPFEMNYNLDTYHVNSTRSLFVRLDGSYLRVSYPQKNIPRRAMYNESRHEMQFIHQQHYDITGASIELLPEGLARKRQWSKKYPICLRIPNAKQAVLSGHSKTVPNPNHTPKSSANRRESPIKKMVPRINESNEVVLYLFSRTDREKDLWYFRFKKASQLKLLKIHSPYSSSNIAAMDVATPSFNSKRTKSMDLAALQLSDLSLEDDKDDLDGFSEISMTKQQKFEIYMSHLLSPLHADNVLMGRERKDAKAVSTDLKGGLAWLNVLLGRFFFDFLTESVWAQIVAERIQRKLSKIKLPAFLNELTVKNINLGTALPKIHRASEPDIDQRGLWVDIDLSYNGSFQMTLETKINLLRLKSATEELSASDTSKGSINGDSMLRSPVYNSEEEDSADTSSDEELPLVPEVNEGNATDGNNMTTVGSSTSKKLLRFVDRLAQSTYFQHAAKTKFIKKAMKDISNTPLILTVEVQWLTGTLALNIPPMPTDRLWYGFRTNPHLSIVARPKLGQHAVTMSHVTEWIEKKLVSEFQKILVMPNMDDLMIPIMQSDFV